MSIWLVFLCTYDGETTFKADPRLKHESMFHWMDYLNVKENRNILHDRNHTHEIRIGPYRVDGYDPQNNTIYEFNGCYHHGCTFCGKDKTEEGKAKKERTEERYAFLKDQVSEVVTIWEHEFNSKIKPSSSDYDSELLEFVEKRQPYFYQKHKYSTVSKKQILDAVIHDELFGFVEVDLHVPDHLHDTFQEMSPIFCNTEIPFEQIGSFMQNHMRKNNISDKPRHLLVGGMAARKILLSSPLLKWYLTHGLQVTHIYQVIEYRSQRCFKKFVSEVSDARREGDRDVNQAIIADTMKLIGNSAYGSLIMDKEKHMDVKYIEGKGKTQLKINDPRFRKLETITENLYEVEMAKNKIVMDLPIQLGYHILQLAKLRMLQFKYDFLDQYCIPISFEYIEMDTDSAYMALAGNNLEDIIKPDMMTSHKSSINGRCNDAPFTARDGFFPRSCCKSHVAYDKRTPGLFKIEAEGLAMIALCSKSYILQQANGKVKFSSKGMNKSALNDPFSMFKRVLDTKIAASAINRGIRRHEDTVFTYEQERTGLSYFYCKREVLPDGIHTKPLSITLSPWLKRETEVVDEKHPWCLTATRDIVVGGSHYPTLAEACKAISKCQDPCTALMDIIPQLPRRMVSAGVDIIFAIPESMCKEERKRKRNKEEEDMFWSKDAFWTSGLSQRSSRLVEMKKMPGQNQLGQCFQKYYTAT